MERMTNSREYRIWRTARRRHLCFFESRSRPHYIERGARYGEYVLMPGHDYNGGPVPYRVRICADCVR